MESGKYDSSREEGFPDSESQQDIWRGWIVPVGDAIPDRHKAGLRCRALAGVDRSGRGCNPRPAPLGVQPPTDTRLRGDGDEDADGEAHLRPDV